MKDKKTTIAGDTFKLRQLTGGTTVKCGLYGLAHDGSQALGNYVGLDQEATDFPISLYKGEKREYVTDISLSTPAGALTFTRTYRQSKQANYTFMGRGWTHNHNLVLTKTPGTPNTIVVQMGNGAEVHFTETYVGSNTYAGDVGSTSTLSWDGTKYTLVATDKSKYVFDTSVTGAQLSTNVVQITSLVYPSGETLTYAYDGTSKKLTTVTDTYGKGYQFSYLNHASFFDDGKLQRVDAVSNSSPTGQSVVFTYLQERLSGSVNGTGALLSTVRDVRGNTWTYSYYGQNASESDSNQKDFLTGMLSPGVDPTGAGLNGSPLSLKQLIYQMSGATIAGITQLAGGGLVRIDFAFQSGGQNITTQTVAGKTTTHRFAGNLYLGPQDPAGNASSQLRDPQSLRPATQIDAKGNQTNLVWSSDGKFLQQVSDALGNPTYFTYDTTLVTINGVSTPADRLLSSLDAQGRKTQYTYADSVNPRLPTRLQVYMASTMTKT